MRHHKQVERLMLFAQVAETLSFTQAAKALGVSRAHLSEQVRRLEQDIGAPLLIRTTRAVRLTEEGERIRQRMQSVHGELLALERELEHDIAQTSESLEQERRRRRGGQIGRVHRKGDQKAEVFGGGGGRPGVEETIRAHPRRRRQQS